MDRGQPILPTGETGSLAIFGMASMLVVAVVLILSLWFTLGKAPSTSSPVARTASSARTTSQQLASTVPFGLVARCASDAKTLDIAVAAAMAENPAGLPSTSATWRTGLLTSSLTGGPFLQSWPSGAGYYSVSVAGVRAAADSGDAVRPGDGDVLVTISAGSRTFDFTLHPATACASLPTP
jgi:hypothetical protein